MERRLSREAPCSEASFRGAPFTEAAFREGQRQVAPRRRSGLALALRPEQVHVVGVVELALGVAARAEDVADQDQRGARDLGGADLLANIGKGAPDDLLVGPARAVDDANRAVGAVMRRQRLRDVPQISDREVDGERRARGAERRQLDRKSVV